MTPEMRRELEEIRFQLQRERGVDECQKLMSKYVIRLMTGDLARCADLWAKREDSRVEMSWGVYDGYEGVRACYDKCHVENLGDMIGILPVHALTTPVIEVAADCQTARAVWISPGFESHPDEENPGKAGCNWAWMKYGVDFICEDGTWYIWHMTTYGLFMTDYYKSWGDSAEEGERNALALLDELSPEAQPTRMPYHKDWNYAVDRAPDPAPIPPEPYETWDKDWYGY